MFDSIFFLFIALVALGVPLAGLVLGLVSFLRTGRLERELHALQGQLAALRGELRTLREQGALASLRPAATPSATPPAPRTEPAVSPQPMPPVPVESPALAPHPPPPPPPPLPAPPQPAVPAQPPFPQPAVPAPPGQGLEERLGTRLFTWLGSIALFLAGAYLVKFTFDQRPARTGRARRARRPVRRRAARRGRVPAPAFGADRDRAIGRGDRRPVRLFLRRDVALRPDPDAGRLRPDGAGDGDGGAPLAALRRADRGDRARRRLPHARTGRREGAQRGGAVPLPLPAPGRARRRRAAEALGRDRAGDGRRRCAVDRDVARPVVPAGRRDRHRALHAGVGRAVRPGRDAARRRTRPAGRSRDRVRRRAFRPRAAHRAGHGRRVRRLRVALPRAARRRLPRRGAAARGVHAARDPRRGGGPRADRALVRPAGPAADPALGGARVRRPAGLRLVCRDARSGAP